MRICLVYDHLYPATVGGGERWMHDLALRLAGMGHDVTYLTMRHWETEPPRLPGVRVVGLVAPGRVYDDERRALGPPLRFGVAVARHLLRHRGRYDVVHTAAFPYFPLLAAALLRRGRYRLVVDWYEVWTRDYWRRYAGTVVGTVGWLVQRACVRTRHRAFCISHLTQRRLLEEGFGGASSVLPGLYAGQPSTTSAPPTEPLVVYAGRHVREKRVPLLVAGFAEALREAPDLRLAVYGDGPTRPQIESAIRHHGVFGRSRVHGRRPGTEVDESFARAACVATASEREGYGLIVVEAAAHGTPSVVVAGPENAAVELVTDGVNGVVASDATPESIGRAIVRVVAAGAPLRKSTSEWFAANAESLRIDRSLDVVVDAYGSRESL